MQFNVLLTSFHNAKNFDNNKFSVARNKPDWCNYKQLQFLAPFDVHNKPITLKFLSNIDYMTALREVYTHRWDEIEQWLDQLSDAKQYILCCWCPHSQSSKLQLKEHGYFACHTLLIGKMIKLHRPDLIIQLDDDREQRGLSEWSKWYFETPLEKIISGGQTGADHAGLEAAKQLHLKTGGYMPNGFITQDGLKPEMQQLYDMIEHASSKYPPRTFANVKASDGTIRFAKDFNSTGELLTLKAIVQYKRPYIDININNPLHPNLVREWIRKFYIKTLNVAGNAEKRAPGIYDFVVNYIKKVVGH